MLTLPSLTGLLQVRSMHHLAPGRLRSESVRAHGECIDRERLGDDLDAEIVQ
jgi:hypothetical protein